MGLFGPPNIEKLKAKGNIDGLIKALSYDRDATVRRSAATALGEIGDKRVVIPLCKALTGKYPDVRYYAAWALGNIGDSQAVDPLCEVLREGIGDECETAAWALGKIGDPRAVHTLSKALAEINKDVRIRAAEALGEIRDIRAVVPLCQALRDEDPTVSEKIMETLAKIGQPAVEILYQALKDDNKNIRSRAALTLGTIGNEDAIYPLTKALKDEDKDVRWHAANALGQLGVPDDQENKVWYMIAMRSWDKMAIYGKYAVEPLFAVMKDSDQEISDGAVQALVKIGKPAVDTLTEALKDNDVEVRERAAKALVAIGLPSVMPLYAAMKDKNYFVRKNAADVLGRIGLPDDRGIKIWYFIATENWDEIISFGKTAVEPLCAVLKDDVKDVRWHAAQVLCRVGDSRAVDALSEALNDSDTDIRRCAAEALGKTRDQRAVKALKTALKDPDTTVALYAAESLGEIADYQVVDPLCEALRHIDSDVRFSAAIALSKIGIPEDKRIKITYLINKEKWDELVRYGQEAVEPLVQAMKEGDQYIHNGAADTLVKIGSPSVDMLCVALQDMDRSVRARAAEALGEIGDPRAAKPLSQALTDTDGVVLNKVSQALVRIGQPAVEPLTKAMKIGNIEFQKNVAKVLHTIGLSEDKSIEAWYLIAEEKWDEIASYGQEAVEPLYAVLNDRNSENRAKAAKILDEIGVPEDKTIQIWHLIAERKWDEIVSIGQDAVEPLCTILKNSDREVRLAAVETLDKIGIPEDRAVKIRYLIAERNWGEIVNFGRDAVEPLYYVLKDNNKYIRERAAEALIELGQPSVQTLIAALNDASPAVQTLAANALQKIYKMKTVDLDTKRLIFSYRDQIGQIEKEQDVTSRQEIPEDTGDKGEEETDFIFAG